MSRHRGLLVLIGTVALALWLLTVSFQVQTSESVIAGQSMTQTGFHFDWRVIAQPYYLIMGGYSGVEAVGVLVAWVIEISFLVLVFMYDAAIASIGKGSRRAAEFFMTGIGLIAIFNIVTDFLYAGRLNQGIGIQLLVAGCLSFAVAFFGAVTAAAFEKVEP